MESYFLVPPLLILLFLVVLPIIVMWRVFRKAGYAGWNCLIPVYNAMAFYEICGMSSAWVWLGVSLGVFNLVIGHMPMVELMENSFLLVLGGGLLLAQMAVTIYQGYRFGVVFGKSKGFCIFSAILLPIAALIVAFDNSEWRDPSEEEVEEYDELPVQ